MDFTVFLFDDHDELIESFDIKSPEDKTLPTPTLEAMVAAAKLTPQVATLVVKIHVGV